MSIAVCEMPDLHVQMQKIQRLGLPGRLYPLLDILIPQFDIWLHLLDLDPQTNLKTSKCYQIYLCQDSIYSLSCSFKNILNLFFDSFIIVYVLIISTYNFLPSDCPGSSLSSNPFFPLLCVFLGPHPFKNCLISSTQCCPYTHSKWVWSHSLEHGQPTSAHTPGGSLVRAGLSAALFDSLPIYASNGSWYEFMTFHNAHPSHSYILSAPSMMFLTLGWGWNWRQSHFHCSGTASRTVQGLEENLVVGDMAKVGAFCFDTENYQFVTSNNKLCPGLCLPVHGKYVLFVGTLSVFLDLAFGRDVC